MSKTLSAPPILNSIVYALACASLCLLFVTGARAQSSTLDQPTPVTSNQIAGEVSARDIGDSRLTRHFYILTGTPGDLVITVESRNLDGDVDLFQSGTLRPLAKVSMYAGEASRTSKSIYLKERETIIMRVEARTPNDDKGNYKISFSGGFEAMAAPPASETETEAGAEQATATTRRDKSTRRVSSVGARINEPEPAPAETATTTQPEAASESPANASTKEAATGNATTSPEPVTTRRAQRVPSARGNRRRRGRVTPPTPPETSAQDNPSTDTGDAPPALASQPTGIEAGAKLIIETRDGMRVERFMNTIRRVTVENGQIVVIMKDGKVARHPMANVTRMAIEP